MAKDKNSMSPAVLLARKEETIRRMMHSRSWRMTAPLRKLEMFLRGKNGIIPRLVRSLGFNMKTLFAPGKDRDALRLEARKRNKIDEWKKEACTPGIFGVTKNVSVVIVSHNYGRYLEEAIRSVLDQTLIPSEIVVVDDASVDDTREVAERFRNRGVMYARGDWHHVSDARNAGAKETNGQFLLFLDADDMLHRDYVSRCLEQMRDPRVAIVYGDMWEFGESQKYELMPAFDRTQFDRENFISSHALMRRQAYDLAGGYRRIEKAPSEDWDFYRRILSYPYEAKKADTYVRYRIHRDSLYQKFLRSPKRTYCDLAALDKQPITIFTPFAGRASIFDRYLEALQKLECDPQNIHLHWFNTSGDPAFDERLRSAMSLLPFARMTYSRAPLPKLWNRSPEDLIKRRMRSTEDGYYYEMAVVYAYNTLLYTCDTQLALTLEDDIAPEPSALRRMLETMEKNTVAVVAPYRCQIRDYMLVWNCDAKGEVTHVKNQRTGVEEVGGSGFGCSLFRMSALKSQPIFTSLLDASPQWYDRNAFFHLATKGKILCNWDIRVEHLKTNRFANPASAAEL